MDREQFAKLQALFEEVCDAPEERRQSTLASLRRENPEMAGALARLLRNDSGSTDRLESLKGGLGHLAWSALHEPTEVPEQIADFRVLGVLGSGGMGTVYRAEQRSPRRLVALKVLRAGATAPASLARFELEAEVLGRLQHPGIAQIFSAGTAAIGRLEPYFAMELVEGETLTSFARARELALRDRIALLIEIAVAVHHAHQKGVIHRDLKPANILVTESGQPKILDFGVARLLERDAAAGSTSDTRAGQVVGTLSYMSPEQVAGRSDAVDTRADIYALGVIAYELLGGRLPYHLEARPLPEVARIVCETEPPRLGTLARELRGDVETIVAKALAKDPAQRYESAHDFAADLRRFLRHEPIEARVPSALDRTLKFARRHRGLVTGLGVALLAIIAGVIGLSLSTARARHAERLAQALAASERENAAIATATHQLLDRVLSAPDPWAVDFRGGRDVRVVDLLARAETELATSFHGSPAVESAVRSTLGRTYSSLARYDRALPQTERAFAIARSLWGDEDGRTLSCQRDLAAVQVQLGNYELAESLARACVATLTRVAGESDTQTLEANATLLSALRQQNKLDEAHALAQRTYELARATLGEDHDTTVHALHNFAAMLIAMGHAADAEQKLRTVLSSRTFAFGPDHPRTLATLGLIGEAVQRQGRPLEAQKIARQLLAAYREKLGPDHPRTLQEMHALATLLMDADQLRDSFALREELLTIAREKLGPEHPQTLDWTYGEILLLHQMMHFDEAERACRNLIEIQRRVDPGQVIDSLNLLATVLSDQRRSDAALPVFEEVLTTALSSRLPAWRIAKYRANHANCLLRLDRFEEAEAELSESLAELEAQLGREHEDSQYALAKLVLTYEATGQTDLARELRAQLTPAGRIHAAPGRR